MMPEEGLPAALPYLRTYATLTESNLSVTLEFISPTVWLVNVLSR
ncbi:protein of unknown function [Pseudomonas inefficax]|uniref:Uncharacterized protein n=1 Tax=Pseudomonas inefficax TaxID=2078786 RepID=A0AAQ1P759_9PSED|nr:protein of unknown function [Pseudomonas inefficax]